MRVVLNTACRGISSHSRVNLEPKNLAVHRGCVDSDVCDGDTVVRLHSNKNVTTKNVTTVCIGKRRQSIQQPVPLLFIAAL